MSRKKHVAVVTSALLLGAMAMAHGCAAPIVIEVEAEGGGVDVVHNDAESLGSSSGDDSGGEGGVIVIHNDAESLGSSSGDDSGGEGGAHKDAGSLGSSSGDDSGSEGGGGVAFDSTTGKACTSDADCVSTNPDAPGIVRCSLTLFSSGAIFPSGVCLIPPVQGGNCSTPSDGLIHFCDGPDDQGSPGVCFPLATGSAVGNCYPKCVFSSDATAPTGCVGKNACSAVGFGPDANNTTAAVGVGFCYGGCELDSDCPSENHCQTNIGLCLTTLTAQEPEGQACTQPVTSNACDCLSKTGTVGFCGLACVTAGSVACPTGQVCDAFLPTSIPAAGGALTGWTTQNPGMSGFCLPTCALDGAAQTEAGTCYPASTCLGGTAVGPDCEP